jgi:hypothetical protein
MPYKKNHTPTQHNQVLYELKQLIVAAGGQVKESGDGTSVYNASGDCISSSSIMGQNSAWYRVRLKDAGDGIIRELCVQHYPSSSDSYYRVKYTCGTFTGGGGSASQTPACADTEIIIAGGGTDASPTFVDLFHTTSANTYRGVMYAQSNGPGVYACYVPNAGGAPIFTFWIDPVIVPDGVTDPDPVVVGINSHWQATEFDYVLSGGCSVGWLKKGALGGNIVRIPGLSLRDYSGAVFPNNAADNPHNGAMELQDVVYHRAVGYTAPVGRKGASTFFRWLGTTQTAWVTLDVGGGTKNFFCCGGDLAVGPWDGTDPFGA